MVVAAKPRVRFETKYHNRLLDSSAEALSRMHPNSRAVFNPKLAERLNAHLQRERESGGGGRYFDRFLIGLLSKEVPHLFTKVDIMDETYANLPRPEFYKIDNAVDPGTFEAYVDGMLHTHHSAYLKGESTSGVGDSLMRMDFDGKRVTLTIPDEEFKKRILKALSDLQGKDNFLQHYTSDEKPREIVIPTENRTGNILFWKQPFEEIIPTLTRHVIPRSRYLLEKPLNIPLYNGRTWEVRNIVQCRSITEPVVTARYGKIGGDDKFGNMLLGGVPVKAEEIVSHVCADTGNRGQEDAFLQRSNMIAIRAARLLNSHLLNSASNYISAQLHGFNLANFFARMLAVDITGHLGRNGKLFPAIIEIQYPTGYNSYVPELQKVDPKALERVEALDRETTKRDEKLIAQFLA